MVTGHGPLVVVVVVVLMESLSNVLALHHFRKARNPFCLGKWRTTPQPYVGWPPLAQVLLSRPVHLAGLPQSVMEPLGPSTLSVDSAGGRTIGRILAGGESRLVG